MTHTYRTQRFPRCLGALLATILLVVSLPGAPTNMVPMRDGVRIATDVHLPDGEGSWPVLLARSPYGRGGPEHVNPWVDIGLAVVIQDIRGFGDSEGGGPIFSADAWGTLQDMADTVEWIRRQPWCNGIVVTWGGSALGITQNLGAGSTQALTCQTIQVAPANFYHQMIYQGGVWRKSMLEGWLKGIKKEYMIGLWKSHFHEDGFWETYDIAKRSPYVEAPAVHIGGWFDMFAQGTLDTFTSRQDNGGPGARGYQKLIMGPWTHHCDSPNTIGELVHPENTVFGLQAYITRFYEYWALKKHNNIYDEPAVHYYVIGDCDDPEAPGNEWRTAEDWPPFETTTVPHYLMNDGVLSTEAPTDATATTFAYDPDQPVPTRGGRNYILPAGSYDQRELGERDDVLVWRGPVLEEPLEICGRIKARLHVSTDAPDTDFIVKLVDIYPDGREMLMVDGIQRLKWREGYRKPVGIKPGEVVEVEVDLWSTSWILNTGHRLGVHVTSSNYPTFDRNPNTGDNYPEGVEPRVAHNTLHLGPDQFCALMLPTRP